MLMRLVIFTSWLLASGWTCNDNVQKESNAESHDTPLKMEANNASFTYLVIRGILNAGGDSLLKMEPLQKIATQQKIAFPAAENKFFEARVHYIKGDTDRIFFDALVASDAEGQLPVHGFFELYVRVKERPEKIEIINSKNGKVIFTFDKNSIPDF